MLKIVKGYGYGYAPAYSVGEPVKIDNTVYMPGEDEETGEVISAEEQRRRAEEERAEQERRINEEIETRYAQMLAEHSAALEQERAKILEDSRNEAATLTAEAKAATMAVMEKAKRECSMLKEQARKEGYDEGFSEGKKDSLDKYEKYIDASGRLLAEINSRKEAYYVSAEEEMRQTVFELVNKIVRTELKINPQVIEGLIADAAKNFRNSDYIKITLAEDGITERFRTDEKLVKDIIPFIPEVEIELDEDAEEGTVIVDNGSEIVDAGVPTQLEFLKEIMRTTRGEGGSEVSEAFEIASDSVQGESLEESAAKGVEDSAAGLTGTGDTAEAYAAEEAATAAESTAEPEDTVSEAEEEVPQQVNFADVMADVMSGRAEESAGTAETAGQDEVSETAGDEAAALMADLMEEAKAAGVQTDKTEAAEITAEEVPKPAKSRKKKQAAE
ncbi:MAG: FliH/SctL family protein [Oscillospiraceae bacterium]|nr:FliH/SctL family protein [Oscillospiraceae bacterium]